jgi:cation diffusion facilitator family transporter
MPHDHVFLGSDHADNHRRTWIVIAVTAAMMVAEILCGTLFGSMALLADGWHMATHAGALSISVLAYGYAHRHASDPAFAFGTGKVGDLAGFASAVVLAVVALWIGAESCLRLFHPVEIAFDEAIWVAVLGLLVNVACAVVLGGGGHHHDHGHDDDHDHGDGEAAHGSSVHHDHNLRSAYLHVLADAVTSLAAIGGLLAGKLLGWSWFDPVVGVLGGAMIASWAVGLVRDTASVLLDRVPSQGLPAAVRSRLERDGDVVADLHLWRLGPGHVAAIVVVETDVPRPAEHYRERLGDVADLAHVTIEVVAKPGGRELGSTAH